MRKSLKRGIFITFEGPEGCGKSTQSKLLHKYLKGRGYDSLHTREPGGTKLGELVRRVLLHSKGVNISDMSELFLFESCRAEIVKEIIEPNLVKGRVVICDRFSDATRSYQGYGGGVSLKAINALDKIATGALSPDLTILLDIDTAMGLRRARNKGVDRMEKKDVAYHRRVRRGYLALAKAYPRRIKVIKVTDGIDRVHSLVRDEVEIVLQRYKRAG